LKRINPFELVSWTLTHERWVAYHNHAVTDSTWQLTHDAGAVITVTKGPNAA
jgi:hypothetical protein